MSFTITTDVFCDTCPVWTHGDVAMRVKRASAWAVAKSKGWKMIKGKHICPQCLAKVREVPNGE